MFPDGETIFRVTSKMFPDAQTNSGRQLKCFRTAKEYSGRRIRRPVFFRTPAKYFRRLGNFYKCASVCSVKCKQSTQEHYHDPRRQNILKRICKIFRPSGNILQASGKTPDAGFCRPALFRTPAKYFRTLGNFYKCSLVCSAFGNHGNAPARSVCT